MNGGYIELVNGVYKQIYNVWGHHLVLTLPRKNPSKIPRYQISPVPSDSIRASIGLQGRYNLAARRHVACGNGACGFIDGGDIRIFHDIA
jgi:hypothetical protein